VRELVFVALSGLAHAPAVAVAAIARLLFIVVDAGGGITGLLDARRQQGSNAREKEQESVP